MKLASAIYAPSSDRTGINTEALANLAARTGGRVVTAEDLPRQLHQLHLDRRIDLWPWLLAAAVVVMLGEWLVVASRR